MTKKGGSGSLSKHSARGIADYALAVMTGVDAFALTLRVPQGNTLRFFGYK